MKLILAPRRKYETPFDPVFVPLHMEFVHVMAARGPEYIVCSRCGLWMMDCAISREQTIHVVNTVVPKEILVQGIMRGACFPCGRLVTVTWGVSPDTKTAT